jgi:hypothetical protein
MKAMKVLFRISGILVCSSGCGCDGPEPPSIEPAAAPPAAIQKAEEAVPKPDEDAFERQKSFSLEDLEKRLWAGNADEAQRILFELTRRRTDEGCRLMIKFLREQSAKLPKDLPSLEEMKKFEAEYAVTKKRPDDNNWTQTFGKAMTAAGRLVLLDMPAADQAAKEFREELAVKWKGSELGALLQNHIQMECEQAKESVRTGAVPWTRPK